MEQFLSFAVPEVAVGGTWKLGTYLAILGAVAAVSFALPEDAAGGVRLSIAAAGLAVLVVAVIVRRPARRAAWWLIALSGVLTFAEGVVIAVIYGLGTGERVATVPEVVLVILALLAAAAGLAVLGWRSSAGGRWNTLDTAITATGAFLLAWVFYIDPALAHTASDFATVVAVAIPATALLVFAMAVKLAFCGGLSTWSGRMLLLAAAAGLVSSGLLITPVGAPIVQISLPILASWLAYMVLLGAAGVAPGMTAVVGDRRRPAPQMLPIGRVVLFVLLALVAPVNVAIGYSHAGTPGPALAALVVPPVCGTLILLILVARLAMVARVAKRHADELGERSASLARAIGRQHELQRQLAYRALHDPLTGLANRDVLIDRMERIRETGGTGEPLVRGQALMMVDLDGFKNINDSLGHPMGDQLLIDVAQRLVGAVPNETVVARLGGDEFAVLLENTSGDQGRRAAEAIRGALRTPYFVAGREVFMSASIGLLITEPGAQPPSSSDGLRDADQALYDAKSAGRDRVVEFRPEPYGKQLQQASMITGLRHAVARGELILHYQPIVALEDGRTVGVEALVRWWPAGGEMVPPARFLPVAEQIGVITEIGAWILRQACRDARAWQAEHGVTVGVNVSGRQLADPTFAERVLETLAETGVPGSALILELPASSLIENTIDPGLRAQLDRLRNNEVQIAIDDFGTDDSSPSGIARLPVDIVKIDSSLSQRPAGSTSRQPDPGWALVQATLQAVSSLHLSAVAEGIETGEQADTLRRLGCPYGQGYYFSPPVPADRIEGLLGRPAALQPR